MKRLRSGIRLQEAVVEADVVTAGYLRIVLTIGALAFAFSYPEVSVGAYFLA